MQMTRRKKPVRKDYTHDSNSDILEKAKLQLPGIKRERGLNGRSARHFRSGQLLCMICNDGCTPHMGLGTHSTTVNPDASYGLQVVRTSRLMPCLLGALMVGGYACVGAGGFGRALPFAQFCCKPETSLKHSL